MLTITVNGVANGNLYYGIDHARPIARRMSTSRARKGQPAIIQIVDSATGDVVEEVA